MQDTSSTENLVQINSANLPQAPTELTQQIQLSLAYLAYAGSLDAGDAAFAEQTMLDAVTEGFGKVSVLQDEKGNADWDVVWGPAVSTFASSVFEDNALYVARRRSAPEQYTVAVRGTNPVAITDWIQEDFRVWTKVAWPHCGHDNGHASVKISKGTSIGLNALLALRPAEGMPGAHHDLQGFLRSSLGNGIDISFTGHSLGGALSPALGLWFRQQQGQKGLWDPKQLARLSVVAFAGPTSGNHAFATYLEAMFGNALLRVHSHYDIVPHAWQSETMAQLPALYSDFGVKPSLIERGLLAVLRLTTHGYQQPSPQRELDWTWTSETELPSYLLQAGAQHALSYPLALGVPEVLEVVGSNLGWTENLNPKADLLQRLSPLAWNDLLKLPAALLAPQHA